MELHYGWELRILRIVEADGDCISSIIAKAGATHTLYRKRSSDGNLFGRFGHIRKIKAQAKQFVCPQVIALN